MKGIQDIGLNALALRSRLFLLFFLAVGIATGATTPLPICARPYASVSTPGLLPYPPEPVVSLRDKHWTLFRTSPELHSAAVKTDLRSAFDRIFTEHGYDVQPARVVIGGLESWKRDASEMNVAGGLSPETRRAIDDWAAQALKLARESTGEDLEIESIAMGRGHRVGNDEGTLIHADNAGTYLHALVTLEGPTTIAFPSSPELARHRLLSVDAATGSMKVKKIVSREEEQPAPFEVKTGGHCLVGETLMFGGADYVKAKPGRQAIQHASPPTSDLNRLTLFIAFKPKKPPGAR